MSDDERMLLEERASLWQTIHGLTSENAVLKAEVKHLKKTIKDLNEGKPNEEIESLKSECNRWEAEVDRLKGLIRDLHEAVFWED